MSIIYTIETMRTMGLTTISLKRDTKEMLRKLGSKGQTYDDLVRDLIERASIKEMDARWNRILDEEEFIPLEKV